MVNRIDLEFLKIPVSTRKRKFVKTTPEIASKRKIFETVDESDDEMTSSGEIDGIETAATSSNSVDMEKTKTIAESGDTNENIEETSAAAKIVTIPESVTEKILMELEKASTEVWMKYSWISKELK